MIPSLAPVALLLVQALPSTAPPATKPLVLIVSGANNHDWEWTTESLRSILDDCGRFEIDVTFDPASTLADSALVARYDAFVLDYNGPGWGEPANANFLAAVRGGAGVAIVHAADNAFEGWTEYERLVGHLWRAGTGHGAFHSFDVTIDHRDHPVTRGLPDLRAHPDELYHRLVNVTGVEYRVLASAYSDPANGGTGEREPMIVVGDYGEGRVFHTPLGHVWRGFEASHASHADPAFRRLIVRGVEWAATGDVTETPAVPNALTEYERRAGWRLLFDGRTIDGSEGADAPHASVDGWIVAEVPHTSIRRVGITTEHFEDLELEFQWTEGSSGSWNRARILSVGGHVEHWSNGEREPDSEGEASGLAALVDVPSSGSGPIVLRGVERVAFRDLRVRNPTRPPGTRIELFDGESLGGWRVLGEASFTVEGETILGTTGEEGLDHNSFLVTEREFGDFVLELEIKPELPGNSGVQVRSHVNESGRVFGYQIEVDSSERAWSGGLYDEARSGWLQNLANNEPGRRAFRPGEWNRYRIECVGPTIKAWVNGVPTTSFAHHADTRGFIGLQVHGGDDGRIRWRNLVLWELD